MLQSRKLAEQVRKEVHGKPVEVNTVYNNQADADQQKVEPEIPEAGSEPEKSTEK